ncbi:hypothetical protein D3C87_2063780 [compost metagenome]
MPQEAAANGEIEAFGQHVHGPVAEAQEQLQRWVLARQLQQDRRNTMAAEQHGHRDAQTAGHFVPA